MTKSGNEVIKFLFQAQDYGLVFRHQYEVQPGYGETGDIISVTGWFKRPKLSERAQKMMKRRAAAYDLAQPLAGSGSAIRQFPAGR